MVFKQIKYAIQFGLSFSLAGAAVGALAIGIIYSILQYREGQHIQVVYAILGAIIVGGIITGAIYGSRRAIRQETKLRQEEAERHREQQERYRKQMIVLGEGAISRFISMLELLDLAEKWLGKAEVDFADDAFAPFWDSVENAANWLARFDEGIREITDKSSRYTELIAKYEYPPPQFPVSPQSVEKLSVGKTTAERMKAIARTAERSLQFAMIYEQRKANQILFAGFKTLAEALEQMTVQITASLDALADSVNAPLRAIPSQLRAIATASEQHHDEMMDQLDKLKDSAGTPSNVVQRAASILEEEIAAGIVAAKQVEKRFIKVSELRSGKPDEVTQRFRRDSHEPIDILLDKFGFVERTLDRYNNVTMEALLALLPRKEPRLHLYDLIPSYPKRLGKGFRPGLCVATCRAFGGDIQSVLRSAVAIEMFHNAFLIHDDIEDGSEYRRGKPALHVEHGIGIAVNVGDAMNVLSISTLMGNITSLGPRLTRQVLSEIEHMARQSVEGQAMELGWVRDNISDLSTEDYLRMTLKKTCWYTCIHPCRIGALVGTGGDIDLERFNRFGYYMGAAFQIQDDILNLVGDRKKYGKEIGGDIWEGKRTMMLIHVINSCTEDEKERMRLFLSTPRKQRLHKDVRWVYQLISKYDSIEFSRKSARQLARGALREFSVAYDGLPESDDKLFIEDIVLYMIEREL